MPLREAISVGFMPVRREIEKSVSPGCTTYVEVPARLVSEVAGGAAAATVVVGGSDVRTGMTSTRPGRTSAALESWLADRICSRGTPYLPASASSDSFWPTLITRPPTAVQPLALAGGAAATTVGAYVAGGGGRSAR